MIISHLLGGLGNQMFQYAAGRALSIVRGLPLRLDVSDFADYALHQGFELSRVFSCPVELAGPDDLRGVLGWQWSVPIRQLVARPEMRFLRSRHFIVEPHFHFWSRLCDVPLHCYLVGYWQSERYFAGAVEAIRTDFTFRQPLGGQNLEVLREIEAVNAVSLHVRRGDYASNSKTQATHGMCSLAYYQAAIRYIAERVEAPYFFVFSDDVEWVRENLDIGYPCRYVDHNRGAESFNDMRLMSLCKHHVIANSSFSWWGAWLNSRADKIVIAPQKWFANNNNVEDLFPSGWLLL